MVAGFLQRFRTSGVDDWCLVEGLGVGFLGF